LPTLTDLHLLPSLVAYHSHQFLATLALSHVQAGSCLYIPIYLCGLVLTFCINSTRFVVSFLVFSPLCIFPVFPIQRGLRGLDSLTWSRIQTVFLLLGNKPSLSPVLLERGVSIETHVLPYGRVASPGPVRGRGRRAPVPLLAARPSSRRVCSLPSAVAGTAGGSSRVSYFRGCSHDDGDGGRGGLGLGDDGTSCAPVRLGSARCAWSPGTVPIRRRWWRRAGCGHGATTIGAVGPRDHDERGRLEPELVGAERAGGAKIMTADCGGFRTATVTEGPQGRLRGGAAAGERRAWKAEARVSNMLACKAASSSDNPPPCLGRL
jgi:hypothetical protein